MNTLTNNVEVTSTTTSLEDGGIPETTITPPKVPGLRGGIPIGLTTQEAEDSLAKHGYNEVVIKEQPIILQILSRYLGIVPLFITTTAVLSAAIFSDCPEENPNFEPCECNNLNDWASFVLLFIELNLVVYADYMGSKSSGDAMKQLQEASASKVGVRRDNQWIQVPTRELVPGDLVAVTIGMTIPADGIVVHDGEPLKLDYSSLTGEPLPEKKGQGSSILSGAVVLVGEGEMLVTQTGINSSLGTTQALIADAKAEKEKGGELANLLSKVALFLCVYGVLASIIIGAYTGVNFDGSSIAESFKLAFVVLSAILPVTMPLVLTTTLAVGSQELAKDDAVVQRFSAIPEMAGMDILCSDKTGTLTLGQMTVIEEECVVFLDNVTVTEMMELALVCSRIEHSDAIDTAVTKYFTNPAEIMNDYQISKFVPFDPATKKVTVFAKKKSTGQDMCIVKGAPPVLMAFSGVDNATYKKAKEALDEKSARGYKTLAVCIQEDEDSWQLVGFLAILDPPRSDTAHTISKCDELGVDVKMITGDQKLIAIEVAKQLGLSNGLFFDKDVFHPNSHVAHKLGGFANLCEKAGGFAGVSPEHKHRVVTSLQSKNHVVGMTGDGVNDAPALSIANVGIAVAGATDAARGAADIVLQQEGLSTIVNALYGSRTIFKRIETYLTYRMTSSFVFGFVFVLVYCASDYNFPTWTLILISILNDFAVSSSSKDNVVIQKQPQTMKLWKVGVVAASMAIVSSLQTWTFMHSIITHDGSRRHFWGLEPIEDSNKFTGCEAATFNFLVLIITLQLDLIVARSPKPFFMFSTKQDDAGHYIGIPPPSYYVLGAVSISLSIATIIAVYWQDNFVIGSGYGMSGMGWKNAGLVWGWALMWFVVTDLIKSAVIAISNKIERDQSTTKPWKTFFQNTLTQEFWDQDKVAENKKLERQSLRSHLVEYDQSLRSSHLDVSDQLSIAFTTMSSLHQLASLCEDETESLVPLTHQDELLSVQTLQDDEALLRIISNMAHTITALQQQVEHLTARETKEKKQV